MCLPSFISITRHHDATNKKTMILQILRYRRAQKKEVPKTSLCVIRLGFEPKTPTLKVLCSTN